MKHFMQQYQGWWQLFTCCHGLRLQPLSSQGFQQNMNLFENEMSLHVCTKKEWNSTYIHVLVGELWKYSCAIALMSIYLMVLSSMCEKLCSLLATSPEPNQTYIPSVLVLRNKTINFRINQSTTLYSKVHIPALSFLQSLH